MPAFPTQSLSTGGGCALELNLNDENIHLDEYRKSEENAEHTDPEVKAKEIGFRCAVLDLCLLFFFGESLCSHLLIIVHA